MVVIGTRPEAIKLAPVVRELTRRRFDVRVCGTGQHERLLDQTLRELGLRPQRHLSVMRRNQTLPELSARLLQAMARVITEWHPSLVVVQGDTGNTGIDSLRWAAGRPIAPRVARWLPRRGHKLVLVTAHRRESFGAPLRAICAALAELAQDPRLEIVYPVHPNPNVLGPVRAALGALPRVRLLRPLPYLEFVQLMKRAALVITDSGGVQEEAPYLGRPVLVIRETTERGEGVRSGHAELVGTDPSVIVRQARRALANRARPRARDLYGDGRAARRIVQALETLLRAGRPDRRS